MLDRFQISGNVPVSIQLLKIIERGLTIDLPHNILHQCRKPKLRVKLKGNRQRAVIFCGCAFRSKKLIKMLAFNLKSLYNLFPMSIGGIKGIFLLLQNVLGWTNMF